MDLFEHGRSSLIERESPLANRMRPRTLDEYAGQKHIIGHGRLLRRAIQADQISSLIFYGPPGTGKTTLAMVIANTTRSHFITINAVLAGVKQIREAIETAQERRNLYGQRTTLFVDEVHRWNKAQQDALLPHVEKGTIILIGATTENPYFEVNKALVSRSRIFQLRPLTEDDLHQIAQQALQDKERGYGHLDVEIEPDALNHLVDVANGDARGVLNALELAVETTPPDENGRIHITLDVAEESIQRRAVLYDKEGDVHYDTISAFIKSVRGSDPDAALYWMAKMIYAGEDPRFIFRRMAILAGEDVGMADPNAITVVISCWQTFERIGMPEGQFPLSQAVIYLATAPKSNTTNAFFDAMKAVEEEQETDVPNHLKDGNRDKEGFGHGKGYLYPHAYREHWVEQQYLPTVLQGKMFYQPSDQGYERGIRDQVARRREAQLAAMLAINEEDRVGEVLTTSPQNKTKESWLQRTISNSGRNLGHQRDKLFELAQVQRHHLVLDVQAGTGLLTWEAVRQAPEGGVWAVTADAQNGEALRQQAAKLSDLERPFIVIGQLDELDYLLSLRGDAGVKFDRIVGRNLFLHYPLGQTNVFLLLQNYLAENGRICFVQTIPKHGRRLYDLVDWSGVDKKLLAKVQKAEDAIYADADDPLVNWDETDIETAVTAANLTLQQHQIETEISQRQITSQHLSRWFNFEVEEGNDKLSYARHLLENKLTKKEVDIVSTLYQRQLRDKTVAWHTKIIYLTAVLSK